ncbi:MAG: substrate-binding periplasmic protein [Gammaproteobacteria bacterium]
MAKHIAAALLLLACAGGALAQAPAPRLTLMTEHSPPASMRIKGEVTGIATDKVREMVRRAGIDYTLELLPWKRAYTVALRQTDACVFSTTRTPEREKLFKWVGPTDEAEWVLMGRADRSYALRTLEDARSLRIGTYNGDARDEYLRTRGFNVDPAPTDSINPRKLLANRIDLWAAVIRRDPQSMEQHKLAGQIVPVLVFNRVRVYLACNTGVPDALIDKMNAALELMNRDGTARRIDAKYEHWTSGALTP